MVDLERDYAKSLKHIAKKLGLPKQHSDGLKLSHVRDGGREVEIYDGQYFRHRAHDLANVIRFRLSSVQS
jgi:hypothetical protein